MQTTQQLSQTGYRNLERIGSIEGHGSQFRKGGEIVQEIDYYLFSKKIEQFPGGKI